MIGTTDTDRSGETFTRVAVMLGSGKVHYARKYDGWGVSPVCGGNRASERYRVVNLDVECKRCLKLLAIEEAAEQAHQDRVDASMQPATEAHDLGYVAPVAETTETVTENGVSAHLDHCDDGTAIALATEGHSFEQDPQLYVSRQEDGSWTGCDDYDGRYVVTTGATARECVTAWLKAITAPVTQVQGSTVVKPPATPAGVLATILEAIEAGDAEWTRQNNGPDAERVALDTIEKIRQLATEALAPVTEVRAVLDSDKVGEAHCGDRVVVLVQMQGVWRAVGTGIAGADLDDVMRAYAADSGVNGPVTVTVVQPKAPASDLGAGWPVFHVGPGRYAVSPRIKGPFGGMDSVKYYWVDGIGQADQRTAYPDAAVGTIQRQLWDARRDYDMARNA